MLVELYVLAVLLLVLLSRLQFSCSDGNRQVGFLQAVDMDATEYVEGGKPNWWYNKMIGTTGRMLVRKAKRSARPTFIDVDFCGFRAVHLETYGAPPMVLKRGPDARFFWTIAVTEIYI
jgi:hypothetical protein